MKPMVDCEYDMIGAGQCQLLPNTTPLCMRYQQKNVNHKIENKKNIGLTEIETALHTSCFRTYKEKRSHLLSVVARASTSSVL